MVARLKNSKKQRQSRGESSTISTSAQYHGQGGRNIYIDIVTPAAGHNINGPCGHNINGPIFG